MIFFGGIVFLAALAAGLLVFAYKLLPKNKKARTVPVEEFAHAHLIRIPLSHGEEITVRPDSPAFGEIIGNFTAETGDPSYNTFSETLSLKIRNTWYTLELSIDGWNFAGEEKNCRRLRNSIQVVEIIDGLKADYFKTKQ
jgi:hypothetical protein